MKKRSIGVSIFGWWYTIAGGFALLSFPVLLIMKAACRLFPQQNMIFMKQFTGSFYLFYAFIISITTLVAGIGILRLKPWARKLIIIVSAIGMFYSVYFSVNMAVHSSEFIDMSMASGNLPKDTSVETLAAVKAFTQGIMVVSMFIGMLFNAGFIIFVLWFFMRKSVKEQFEPGINSTQPQLK